MGGQCTVHQSIRHSLSTALVPPFCARASHRLARQHTQCVRAGFFPFGHGSTLAALGLDGVVPATYAARWLAWLRGFVAMRWAVWLLLALRCGFAMWSQAMGRVGCGQPGTRSCEGSGNLLRTRWGSGTAGHSAASGLGSMCGGKAHDLRWSQAGLHRTAFARLRTLYRVVG